MKIGLSFPNAGLTGLIEKSENNYSDIKIKTSPTADVFERVNNNSNSPSFGLSVKYKPSRRKIVDTVSKAAVVTGIVAKSEMTDSTQKTEQTQNQQNYSVESIWEDLKIAGLQLDMILQNKEQFLKQIEENKNFDETYIAGSIRHELREGSGSGERLREAGKKLLEFEQNSAKDIKEGERLYNDYAAELVADKVEKISEKLNNVQFSEQNEDIEEIKRFIRLFKEAFLCKKDYYNAPGKFTKMLQDQLNDLFSALQPQEKLHAVLINLKQKIEKLGNSDTNLGLYEWNLQVQNLQKKLKDLTEELEYAKQTEKQVTDKYYKALDAFNKKEEKNYSQNLTEAGTRLRFAQTDIQRIKSEIEDKNKDLIKIYAQYYRKNVSDIEKELEYAKMLLQKAKQERALLAKNISLQIQTDSSNAEAYLDLNNTIEQREREIAELYKRFITILSSM